MERKPPQHPEHSDHAIPPERGVTYFAFISYKREDVKWAEWLKRSLESYRLPAKLCKQYRIRHGRCNPVFLDKTDLRPGYLEQGLKSEIKDAKFLIVVCSRNAASNSKYIDLEIQFFLDNGGDPSRIIPFIVDDIKKPEETCFPKRLRELCLEKSIVGANVFENGKHRAFLKVIAYMHGLKVEEVENSDSRRRKRKYITIGIACTAALFLAVIGAYCYWDYYIPKTAYYLDYTEVYGVPAGIHQLDEETMKAMNSHFTLVSQKGKVRELRHENSYGRLTEYTDYECRDQKRPVMAKYEYTEGKDLNIVTCYDASGKVIMQREYGPGLKYYDVLQGYDEYGRGEYLPSNNMIDELNLFAPSEEDMEEEEEEIRKSNVMRCILEYDESGYLTELHYAGNINNADVDGDGVSGIRYERDALGRIQKLYYLAHKPIDSSAVESSNYKIIGTKTGIFGKAYTYDKEDNLCEVQYLGAEDRPVPWFKNVSRLKRTFYKHNQTGEQYYDKEGNAAENNGYAAYEADYDEYGNLVEARFYDRKGELSTRNAGYSSLRRTYDKSGNMTSGAYYDLNGERTIRSGGYASWTMQYDDHGNMAEIAFFGEDGEPVIGVPGCESVCIEYNDDNEIVRVSYRNIDGSLCKGADGFASVSLFYDERGNVTEEQFFDEDGKPCTCLGGYASVKREYDDRNNEIHESYYEVNGDPARFAGDRYVSRRFDYDERGNVVQVSCCDEDGSLILCRDGYAIYKREYDGRGLLIRESYFDTEGKSVICGEEGLGFASQLLEYDERGNEVRESYYGIKGEPVMSQEGFAVYTSEFDERGQLIWERYFGTNNEPVIIPEGCAGIQIEYDDRGNITWKRFYDEDGNPVMIETGDVPCECASVQVVYDETGQIKQFIAYDVAGNLVYEE